jgi:hypothetical protein
MSATLDADELKRLRRLATTAIVLAAVSTAVAVAALVTPYNAALRAHLKRVFVASNPTTPPRPLGASVVEAERFVLRGKAGQVRAELGVQPEDDRAELTLRAPDGTLRAVLATADPDADADAAKAETSLLGLYDRKGKRLATLHIWDPPLIGSESVPGTPYSGFVWPMLELADRAGTTRVSLSASEAESGLDLSDKDGKRASLATGSYGEPFLMMMDRNHVTVDLGYGRTTGRPDARPSLSLSDQQGIVRAILGSADLVVAKTGSKEQTAESSLFLFDKEGHVIFEAPPE